MSEPLPPQLKTRALDEAPFGVVITDATADDDPIVYANAQFSRLTGYDVEEVIGRNCRFLQGPDTDPEPVAELRDAVEADREASVELLNYRTDGTPFWNSVTIAPIEDESGAVTHHVGFQRDVTDRVEGEQALRRQKERLDQFANVISHDLKNPLNVISVALDLAEETGDPEHFERSRRTIEKMNSMIDDLLTLAREGERVGDLGPVDLGEVAADCWADVDHDSATLRCDVDRTVLADADRLAQLLQNLLLNAVEHGGEGVTVTVGAMPEGFYVEDDGPGIPPEDRDQVFEAGFTTAREGTGFGLQIVQSLAQAHGWEVGVVEGDAGGARFEITGVETA